MVAVDLGVVGSSVEGGAGRRDGPASLSAVRDVVDLAGDPTLEGAVEIAGEGPCDPRTAAAQLNGLAFGWGVAVSAWGVTVSDCDTAFASEMEGDACGATDRESSSLLELEVSGCSCSVVADPKTRFADAVFVGGFVVRTPSSPAANTTLFPLALFLPLADALDASAPPWTCSVLTPFGMKPPRDKA